VPRRKRNDRRTHDRRAAVAIDGAARCARVAAGGELHTPGLLDGRYPDWRAVMPATPSLMTVQVSAARLIALLGAAAEAHRDAGGDDAGEPCAVTPHFRGPRRPLCLTWSGGGMSLDMLLMPLT
jgi:hypothetical protein